MQVVRVRVSPRAPNSSNDRIRHPSRVPFCCPNWCRRSGAIPGVIRGFVRLTGPCRAQIMQNRRIDAGIETALAKMCFNQGRILPQSQVVWQKPNCFQLFNSLPGVVAMALSKGVIYGGLSSQSGCRSFWKRKRYSNLAARGGRKTLPFQRLLDRNLPQFGLFSLHLKPAGRYSEEVFLGRCVGRGGGRVCGGRCKTLGL